MIAALLVFSLIAGGGGFHAPFLVALAEAIAVPVLIRFALFSPRTGIGPGGASAACLLLIFLLLACLQLVPLPSAIWQTMPGRELLAQSFALTGRAGSSWPISISPQDSTESLLAFLPAVAIFVAVIHIDWDMRKRLCGVIVAVALLSVILGAIQIAAGDVATFYLYKLPPFGLSVGFFANRNHQALFLDCVVPIATAFVVSRSPKSSNALSNRIALGVGLFILALCVLGTASRSGIALLLLALIGSALCYFTAPSGRRRGPAPSNRPKWAIALAWLGAIAVFVGIIVVVAHSYQGTRLIGRFHGSTDDSRIQFWPDVLYTLKLYFPFGAGLGTFDIVYQSAEPLATLSPNRVNHAHNDYMELIIELGAAGGIVIVAFMAWFASRCFAIWRRYAPEQNTMMMRAASVIIVLILGHSIVDYPLRTIAMSTIMAFACGLLVSREPKDAPSTSIA